MRTEAMESENDKADKWNTESERGKEEWKIILYIYVYKGEILIACNTLWKYLF